MSVPRNILLASALVSSLLGACNRPGLEPMATEPARAAATPVGHLALADEVASELLIVDTHIDAPYGQLEKGAVDLSVSAPGRDFDYPRARQGGLDVGFMSIYIPAELEQTGGARKLADELIDMVEQMAMAAPERFTVVDSAAEAAALLGTERVGLALGMENGAPLEGDLAALAHFARRGIRYITLTHSENNHICDSSYAVEKKWDGLSPFGRDVVAEMNRLGIMIDISHVSDAAAAQVLDLSRAPVIASHSSCRHFTPGWERNISDEFIRRLASNGGVVQINFGSAFLIESGNQQSTLYHDERRAFLEEHGFSPDGPEADAFSERYWQEHERIYADVTDVADHIDYVVKLAGMDHVGLGSDFDGVGDSLPTGLKSVAEYPNLLAELLRRGYTKADLEKICGGNLLRVWREVEAAAALPVPAAQR